MPGRQANTRQKQQQGKGRTAEVRHYDQMQQMQCPDTDDVDLAYVLRVCEPRVRRVLVAVLEAYPVRLKTLARMVRMDYNELKRVVADMRRRGLLRSLEGRYYGPGPALVLVIGRWCRLVGGAVASADEK